MTSKGIAILAIKQSAIKDVKIMPCIPMDRDDPNHADDFHWELSHSFLQLLLLTDCPTRPSRIQKTHIPQEPP